MKTDLTNPQSQRHKRSLCELGEETIHTQQKTCISRLLEQDY